MFDIVLRNPYVNSTFDIKLADTTPPVSQKPSVWLFYSWLLILYIVI